MPLSQVGPKVTYLESGRGWGCFGGGVVQRCKQAELSCIHMLNMTGLAEI